MSSATSSKSNRRWWPFGRRTAVAALPAPTPTDPPRDPLTPKPPEHAISAYWATGRVQQNADEAMAQLNQLFRVGKERSFAVLDLHANSTVLDVGCGSGRDVARMMELVGPTGEVWGVDIHQDFIRQAKADHPNGLFVEGDVYQLPFKDHFFDAVRIERVLTHVEDIFKPLAEIIRVTKPGGIISVVDLDCETMRWYPGDLPLIQRFMTFTSRRILKNPRAVLLAFEHLARAGLNPVVEVAGGTLNATLMRAEMERSFATSHYSLINDNAREHAVLAGVITQAESDDITRWIEGGLADNTFLFYDPLDIVYAKLPALA